MTLNQSEGDIFPNRQTVEQCSALEQHSKLPQIGIALAPRQSRDFFAFHFDRSGIRSENAQHALDSDGFAASRAANNHQRFAGIDGEIHAVQHHFRAEALLHLAQLNFGSAVHGRLFREENRGQNVIRRKNENGCRNHRVRGGGADALRAASGIKSVVATHQRDDEPEHGCFGEAGCDIAFGHEIGGVLDVDSGVEIQCSRGDDIAAKNTNRIGDRHQNGHADHARNPSELVIILATPEPGGQTRYEELSVNTEELPLSDRSFAFSATCANTIAGGERARGRHGEDPVGDERHVERRSVPVRGLIDLRLGAT